MDISRRSFLKGLGSILVLSQVPQILIPKHGSTFARHRTVEIPPFYFKGTRYPAYFSRIMTEKGSKELEALRGYDYDIKQVLLDQNPSVIQLKPFSERLAKDQLIYPAEVKIITPDPELIIKWNDDPPIEKLIKSLVPNI